MTQSKATKEAANRACNLTEDDIVIMLMVFVERYQQAKREGQSAEETHEIFLSIEEMSMIVLMKAMGKTPLNILSQLEHIEKAVNIITPHKG